MRKQILTGFLIGLCLTLCVLLSASKIDAATKTAQDVNYPIYIDNVIWTTNTPILNVEGSTYLPLRAMSEALGVTIEWSKEFRRVDVYKEKKPGDFEITGTPSSSGTSATSSGNSAFDFINKNYKNNMNLLGCETAVLDTSDDNLAIVYIKGYNSETKTYEKQIRFDLTEKIYKEYEGSDSVWVQFNLSGNPTAVSHNASPILDIEDEVYVKAVKNFKENLNILETQILGNNNKTILYGQTVTQLKEKAY